MCLSQQKLNLDRIETHFMINLVIANSSEYMN